MTHEMEVVSFGHILLDSGNYIKTQSFFRGKALGQKILIPLFQVET